MSLKAPYNFVPLNATVVRPHWASYVSHDLPFDDAQSGHLEIELQTHSPLYVRNGVLKDAPDTEKTRFNHHNGSYFIPGSSLKGMLRSVLEIMSFGRISDKIDDVTLAQRDFSNPDIYQKEKFAKEICCGWMKKVGDEYQLRDCGRPGRIMHEELSGIATHKQTGIPISAHYQQNLNFNSNEVKSAKSKYELFFSTKTNQEFGFKQIDEKNTPIIKKYTIDKSSSQKGWIVMTGQPAIVDPNAGKRMAKHSEFVFFTSKNSPKTIDERVIKNLKVAFFDGEKNESLDWTWRKGQLENGEEIPVFFRREGEKIKDLGLSFLYKMAYNHSIKELAKQDGDEKAPDLADTIFGYVDGNREALKGRVQVSHAFAQGTPQEAELRNDVLAGPKPTYYPTYIRQESTGNRVSNYVTYNNDRARISGWKRYPIRADGMVSHNAPQPINGVENMRVTSAFVPLQAGTTFQFRINYHNLRRDELGALISAITLHNTPDTYHSLGLAKPLGYGKVSLTILNQSEEERKSYLRAYEGFMRSEVSNWHMSEQIGELVAMALPKATPDKTGYMELAGFKEAKDNKYYLQKHSQLYTLPRMLEPLLNDAAVSELKAFYAAEKKRFVVVDAEQLIREKARDLDNLKRNWRAMLSNRREEVKGAEEEADRKAKSRKAVEGGPDFTDVRVPHKDPLDRMNNEMIKYGRGVRDNCPKDALMKFTQGYALEIHYELIINQFVSLYNHLPDKERQKWKQGKVDALKYLKRWIGPEKATEVFNNLP